jgi:hypothetical protein
VFFFAMVIPFCELYEGRRPIEKFKLRFSSGAFHRIRN